MFRKSLKRDKSKGISNASYSTDEGEGLKYGSLKRHSKLFSFAKKDKKKNEKQMIGSESPFNNDTDGIRVDESFEDKPQKHVVNKTHVRPVSTVLEDNTSNKNSVAPLLKKSHKRTISTASKLSSTGSLSLDFFNTDSSMMFQSFAADVLKATEEKLRGVNLQLPEIKSEPVADSTRIVTLNKTKNGDYGFNLHRTTIKKSSTDKVVHVVEPCNGDNLGLLPGDRLVSVDGTNVEDCEREDIIKKIAMAGNTVTLKVVPVPEFSELSSRTAAIQKFSPQLLHKSSSLARSGSLHTKMLRTSHSEKNLAFEKSWRETEKVWLVHQNGFSSGVLSKAKNQDGDSYSYKVKLDHGGEVIEGVDEDAVEKINPPQFDRTEDLSTLRYLNESGCLHTLRQRYAGNLIQTHASNKLVIIKPKEKLAVYTEKVMQMFKGCKREDMPPHIYATAQAAYRQMFSTNSNQSIVMLGHAGAGKTFNTKQLMDYLTTVYGSTNNNATASRMNAVTLLLESFTHARTCLSMNASFCSVLYTLDFDLSGLVIGASLQNYFLDRSRVSHVHTGESSYRVFYEMLDGCSGELKDDLMLDLLPRDKNVLFDFDVQLNDKEERMAKWKKVVEAFTLLNINKKEIKGIMAPLAAVLYLGAAGISTVPGMKPYFAQPACAQKAATILGTTEENLARVIFGTSVQVASRSRSNSLLSRTESSTSRSSMAPMKLDDSTKTGALSPAPSVTSMDSMYDAILIALESFTAGLYIEAFTSLMRLINRAVNSHSRVQSCINVFDGAGFQNKTLVNKANSLEDLRTNYCVEKLQWLMHHTTFAAQVDRYQREDVDCTYSLDHIISPEKTILTIDKLTTDRRISHSDLRASISELKEAKGLFWIVEEEAVKSNANEVSLVQKIAAQHALGKGNQLVSNNQNLPEIFMVSHLQNTVPVKYDVNGWLKRVKEHPAVKMAYSVLSDSTKSYVTELYAGHQSGTFQVNDTPQHSRARRKSQHMISSVRRNSISMQYKTQMDRIIEQLERTCVHYVYCLLPDPLDGLLDPNTKLNGGNSAPSFNIPFVRQQLRSAYLLESMRIYRQGYPDQMNFPEFRRRFGILLAKEDRIQDAVLDEKQAVLKMVRKLDIEERTFKLGISQIFFRAGVLPQLEDKRDEDIGDVIIDFQALCRGVLARKELKKKQVQRLALHCIQRNVRKFLLVRNWPWWRLYTKVSPLLDVHRTEEELKTKTSELSLLNGKIAKLERNKEEQAEQNSRLKKKVQELASQLSQIHSSATGAGELLDLETSERIRLEEELQSAKVETKRLSAQYKKLESDYCNMKLNSITNGYHGYKENGDVGNEAVGNEAVGNDIGWREKYIALSRELENTRRKFTEQSEEEIQELMNQKRTAEKALAEEQSESEEYRRQATTYKRKLNKVNAELEDMKLLLDSLQVRDSDLEKKQRKHQASELALQNIRFEIEENYGFDQEKQNLLADIENEKKQREIAQQERDKYSIEKTNLQTQLSEKEDEMLQLKRKLERLNDELDDYGKSGKSDVEVVALKRQVRDFEVRVLDQEEELDEQAGKIQQLEQAKLKLEMSSQRDKQQYQKELETKDEDIEQLRTDYQRKLRALEEQMDDEVKRREDTNRVKRELERRVFELQNSVEDVDKGHEQKLRKELRKLRILYRDSKTALESQQLKGGDQTEIKTLRNQLEDADFAKHMALKAKVQIEADLEELTSQYDSLLQAKTAADERCLNLTRENGDLQTRIDEAEDEIEDVIRNNKQLIAQLSEAQNSLLDSREKYRVLEDEKDVLRQKVDHLTLKLDSSFKNMVDRHDLERAEYKCRELEAKIETDNAARIKLEHQLNRFKGQFERVQDEKTELQNVQSRLQQSMSRCERQTKEYRDELESIKRLESEHKRRKEEAESHSQNLEEELSRKKHEVMLSEKRIRELQESIALDDSDDDLLLDDYDTDDDTTTSLQRNSSSYGRQSFSRRIINDSYNRTSSSPSFRSRRLYTGDDNYRSTIGVRSPSFGEHNYSRPSSRPTSRTDCR